MLPDSKPARRPRISLQTLLLLMTIIAMGLVIWQLNAELNPLRKEVRKLRDKTGQLTIEDPEKIHAIQMVTDYPLAWKWRVYVPAGRTVRIANHTHQISKEGLPKANNGTRIVGPKEVVVTAKVDKEPSGRWRCGISCEHTTTHLLFPENAIRWLDKGAGGSQWMQVGREVSVEKPGKPLVLLRKRVFYGSLNQIPPANAPEETDGLLVWLVE